MSTGSDTGVDQKRIRDLIAEAFPQSRLDDYSRSVRYYDGEQETLLTDRAKEYLERSGYNYCENFCATVVDALAERLAVVGVTTPENEEFGEWLWDVWDRNVGDSIQQVLHSETLKWADGYLVFGWDETKRIPTWTFNSADLVGPVYRAGAMYCALKMWDDVEGEYGDPIRRLNVYYPDRIEKYRRLSSDDKGDWAAWRDSEDAEWPVQWTFPDGKPIGIPIVHFANNPGSRKFGRAEHRGSIPQQDRLNKELIDLSYVLDTMGWPQRTAAGVDSTAELKSVPGEVWTAPNPEAKFGQFEAANPQGILDAIEATLVRIAARSRTPVFLFSGTNIPSGEALKTAEAGLVARARSRHIAWGAVWVEAFRMAARVALAIGKGTEGAPTLELEAIESESINVLWADPETRNEKEHAETLGLWRDLGVSKQTLLGLLPGIDPEEEMDLKEEEDQRAAEQQAAQFAAGGAEVETLGAPTRQPPQGGPIPRPNPPAFGR